MWMATILVSEPTRKKKRKEERKETKRLPKAFLLLQTHGQPLPFLTRSLSTSNTVVRWVRRGRWHSRGQWHHLGSARCIVGLAAVIGCLRVIGLFQPSLTLGCHLHGVSRLSGTRWACLRRCSCNWYNTRFPSSTGVSTSSGGSSTSRGGRGRFGVSSSSSSCSSACLRTTRAGGCHC